MENNKIIIIVLIVIILALLIGMVAMMPNMTKKDTNLSFKSNSTLTEGDSLKIKLTDDNKTAIANQTVNITITDKDKSNDYHSVVTNEKGIGTLKLDKNLGKYNISVSYSGNGNYKSCNVTEKITIEEKVVEAEHASASSSSSNYDPGAFYSPQYGGMIYTGDVHDSPAGPMRHLGYNQWEPA